MGERMKYNKPLNIYQYTNTRNKNEKYIAFENPNDHEVRFQAELGPKKSNGNPDKRKYILRPNTTAIGTSKSLPQSGHTKQYPAKNSEKFNTGKDFLHMDLNSKGTSINVYDVDKSKGTRVAANFPPIVDKPDHKKKAKDPYVGKNYVYNKQDKNYFHDKTDGNTYYINAKDSYTHKAKK